MKQGTIFFNPHNDYRIGVYFDDGSQIDGLHCGQQLQVLYNHRWVDSRLEYNHGWYFVGCWKDDIPFFTKVRL